MNDEVKYNELNEWWNEYMMKSMIDKVKEWIIEVKY